MTNFVWIRHPDIDAESQVPEGSVPTWRDAGWIPLTEEELAARDKRQAEEAAAVDKDLAELAAGGQSAAESASDDSTRDVAPYASNITQKENG
jgi:hypothetical protein